MTVWALLSDRSLDRALPALADLSVDVKHEPLTVLSLTHVLQIDALAVFVDAVENPGQAWSVLSELHERKTRLPAVVIVDRDHLQRYPWHEVADEFVFPGEIGRAHV